MSTQLSYPRESVEYVFFKTILFNDLPPVDPPEYALMYDLERPTEDDWNTVEVIGGRYAFKLLGNLDPGSYTVWVREAQSGVVVVAGKLRIS